MRDDACVDFVTHGYTAPHSPRSKPASPLRLQMCLHVRVSDSSAVHMTAPIAWSTPLVAVRQTLNTCAHTHKHTHNIRLETPTDDTVELFRPSHTSE